MSLIGLLTAMEKQVLSGHLHMRPIHWSLKNHWHVLEMLEKIIRLLASFHPHLDWWLDEDNVLRGQPLYRLRHVVQLFTDISNDGWGTHLGDCTLNEICSLPENKLHINFLELKAVLLTLKKFYHLCWGRMVLGATDHTTVLSYIHKERVMRLGYLCALV